jgi:DNA-binding NtrC family response regulator
MSTTPDKSDKVVGVAPIQPAGSALVEEEAPAWDPASEFKPLPLPQDGTTIEVGGQKMIASTKGPMPQIVERVSALARAGATPVFKGSTGVGKEFMAHAVHHLSPRKDKPFIVINCAAINPNLLESELFGHEKGSFTGADKQRIGKFEEANGGTIFLDELDKMPWDMQAKLLRAIGSPEKPGEIQRIGGNKTIPVDVRVIGAYGKLKQRNRGTDRIEPTIRPDLLGRLGTEFIIPSLKDRPDDVRVLATHFLNETAKNMGMEKTPALSADAAAFIQAHPWPLGVRELKTAMTTAAVLANHAGTEIKPEHIMVRQRSKKREATPNQSRADQPRSATSVAFTADADVDLGTLLRNGRKRDETATAAGVSPRTFNNYTASDHEPDTTEKFLYSAFQHAGGGEAGRVLARRILDKLLDRMQEKSGTGGGGPGSGGPG